MHARWLALAVLLPLAACQPFETVSESSERVTYRFDPQKVSTARIYSAATDKCQFSPLGGRPAVAVSEVNVGNEREIEFVCQAPGEGIDAQKALDSLETDVEHEIDKVTQ
jgi:hypothetical protein